MKERLGIHQETVDAYTAKPIQVGELAIQPCCFAHLMAIRQRCRADMGGGKVSYDDLVTAAAIFTVPPGDPAAALATMTDDEFAVLRNRVAANFLMAQQPLVENAIRTQLRAARSPALKTEIRGGKKKALSAGGLKPSNSASPSTDGPRST